MTARGVQFEQIKIMRLNKHAACISFPPSFYVPALADSNKTMAVRLNFEIDRAQIRATAAAAIL